MKLPEPPALDPSGRVVDPMMRYTPEQIDAYFWHRPQPGRPPAAGDRVLYRHYHGADPVPVTLDRVHDQDRNDPNVYDPRTGERRADPAPLVEFFYIPAGVRVACREGRVPDSAGWTWPEGNTG